MRRVLVDSLRAGDSVVVTTSSGSTYTFTLTGPRYGSLEGGRLAGATLALLLGSQPEGREEVLSESIEIGHHLRFLCPLVGEIVTTPVRRIVVEAPRAA